MLQLRDVVLRPNKTGLPSGNRYVAVDTSYIPMENCYETMVFRCTKNGTVRNWTDMDFQRYKTEEEAKAGHQIMVEKWKGELNA